MRIAILLLCHEAPAIIAARLASPFYRGAGVKVYIHHDRASPHHDRAAFAQQIPAEVQWQWLDDAVHCEWGEYSLVDATLRLMKAALTDPGFAADYLLLTSGSCQPIRPLASLQEFLRRRQGIDFIQAHDISRSRWVKDGLEEERLRWYFPFNFITQRRWFERACALQRRLGVRRRLPDGLRPHFGSQWFALSRGTSAAVVDAMADPRLVSFFRSTWIPDEFVIQTLVARHQAGARIAGHSLTYYEFDPMGRPLVLDNGHFAHLMRQPFFFARKLAPEATALRAEVDAHCAAPEYDLSYFDRAGQPSIDYAEFILHARQDPSRRSRLGGHRHAQGGPMAVNRRTYYVLVCASPALLTRLLGLARRRSGLPIFDLPFDPAGMQLAAERIAWRGFQPSDRARAQYGPTAFLHELVNVDPVETAAFGLDAALPHRLRDVVARDPNAVLIDCDPPGLSPQQRVAARLRHLTRADHVWPLAPTLQALRSGERLPLDHFELLRETGQLRCRSARLEQPPPGGGDATWAALAEAARGLDLAGYFPSHAAAQALVGGLPGPVAGAAPATPAAPGADADRGRR